MRPSIVVTLLALSAVGCALNRAPIIERSDAGMFSDAPSPFDVPPMPDVSIVEIDAPTTGCTASCGVGERCEGTTCVCDPDLCAGDRACIAGACTACGGPSETCCPDLSCRDGLACEGGRCPASRCDTIGDECCTGDRCDGLTCRESRCIALCGGEGLACCPGDECAAWLSCRRAWDLSNRCQSCGGAAETCCPGGTCQGAMACNFGVCL